MEITVTTDDLVTVAGAARLLKKHHVTIYRWISAKPVPKIAFVKLGGTVYILKSEIERLSAKAEVSDAQS